LNRLQSGLVFCVAIMFAGTIGVVYAAAFTQHAFNDRAILGAGVLAIMIGSGGIQQIYWSRNSDKVRERRARPRYPKDVGPGPGGRAPCDVVAQDSGPTTTNSVVAQDH
jgi:hypothetical protein